MQTSIPILTLSALASAAVTAMRWVNHSGAPANASDLLKGVARTAAASGDVFPIDILGVVRIEAGGAVSAGARVGSDSVGRAVVVTPGTLKTATIAGGAAGDFTVTGIAASDELVAVWEQDGTSKLLVDRTAEFSITAANTINNTGGTALTGDNVIVAWRQIKPIGGIALSAAGAAGQFIDVLLLPQAAA
jgi:hypothetical protein